MKRKNKRLGLTLLSLALFNISYATTVYTIPQDYEKIKRFTEGALGDKTNHINLEQAERAGKVFKSTVKGLTKQNPLSGNPEKAEKSAENVRKFLEGATGTSDISSIANPEQIGRNVKNTVEGITGGSITSVINREDVSTIRKKIDQTFYDMYINPNSCFPQFLQENPFKTAFNSFTDLLGIKHAKGRGLGFGKMLMPFNPSVRWKCSFSDKNQIQQIVQQAVQQQMASLFTGISAGSNTSGQSEHSTGASMPVQVNMENLANGGQLATTELSEGVNAEQVEDLWFNNLKVGSFKSYLSGAYLKIINKVNIKTYKGSSPLGFCNGDITSTGFKIDTSIGLDTIALSTNLENTFFSNLWTKTNQTLSVEGMANGMTCINSVDPVKKTTVLKTLKDKYGRLVGIKHIYGYDTSKQAPFQTLHTIFFYRDDKGNPVKFDLQITNYLRSNNLLLDSLIYVANNDFVKLTVADKNGNYTLLWTGWNALHKKYKLGSSSYCFISPVFNKKENIKFISKLITDNLRVLSWNYAPWYNVYQLNYYLLTGDISALKADYKTIYKKWKDIVAQYLSSSNAYSGYIKTIHIPQRKIEVYRNSGKIYAIIIEPDKAKQEGYYVFTFHRYPFVHFAKKGKKACRTLWNNREFIYVWDDYGPLEFLPEEDEALGFVGQVPTGDGGCDKVRVYSYTTKYYGIMNRIYFGWKIGDYLGYIGGFYVEKGYYAPVPLFLYKQFIRFPKDIEEELDKQIINAYAYDTLGNFIVVVPKSLIPDGEKVFKYPWFFPYYSYLLTCKTQDGKTFLKVEINQEVNEAKSGF